MNVDELYHLTEWINSEIVGKKVPKLYSVLHNILNQNSQPNEQKQPFDDPKNKLFESLKNIPLSHLTIDQVNFLEKLGLAAYIGQNGINVLEEILYKNAIDVATASTKVQEIIASINTAIEKSNAIKKGLEGCVEVGNPLSEEIIIRVNFSKEAAMSNITDLKKWGAVWYDIGRGISMVHNSSPEAIRIIGAKNGSVVLELAASLSIAWTISSIILMALKVAERVILVQGRAEEVRGLRLTNDKIAKELEQEAKKEREKGIEEITTSIAKQLQIKPSGEGDKTSALDKAVKELVNFLTKGGEIDCMIPEEKDETNEITEEGENGRTTKMRELRTTFETIRQLENKVRLLEIKEPDEGQEAEK